MAAGARKHTRLLTAILLSGVAFLASNPIAPAWAQPADIDSLQPTLPDDAKMLLSANELVYNQDAERVIVRGAVQINYGGYQMVAQQVEYSQKTGRIIATGEIELIEPGGNRIYADQMDVTDTFSDGFIETMRLETTDLTKLAAVTAERRNGEEMILNNAVYTACTPCATNPNHRSLWHLKAQRIVQNGRTHTVRMENARFELFGKPILFLPVLELPDHTVKRKSGFLFPKFS
ncbi:MAG TPA: LPS-assembly protein LptD, partial [Pararhizobium sp.]|uniref:LPS-assembly protein LptD n=1 Tax=Pararhizobium sp. TaxID=1977563 RepID=UPI002CEF47EB|nr:LPS-assembly protein LptD [Pararhizobium sp.]